MRRSSPASWKTYQGSKASKKRACLVVSRSVGGGDGGESGLDTGQQLRDNSYRYCTMAVGS